MRSGLLQHLILFPFLPAPAPCGGGGGRQWLTPLSNVMLLPVSRAGGRENPCHPLGNSASQLLLDQDVHNAGAAPAHSGSGDTDARQQLLPDPAAKPNPAEPTMAAYGFLSSLQ